MPSQEPRTGLYNLFMKRLQEASGTSSHNIISFPTVFEKMCRSFSMSKKQCWEILFLLRDVKLIEIVPFHGVRILES